MVDTVAFPADLTLGLSPFESKVMDRLWDEWRHSPVNLSRPGIQFPGYYSKPLVATKARNVTSTNTWVTFLTFTVDSEELVILKQYTATIEGNLRTTPGITFRFKQLRGICQDYVFSAGAERHKLKETAFPTIPQDTFFLCDAKNPLVLQVNNNSGSTQLVLGALYGWRLKSIQRKGNMAGVGEV